MQLATEYAMSNDFNYRLVYDCLIYSTMNLMLYPLLLALSLIYQTDLFGQQAIANKSGHITYKFVSDQDAYLRYLDTMKQEQPEQYNMVVDVILAENRMAATLSFELWFKGDEAVFSMKAEAIPEGSDAVHTYEGAVKYAQGHKTYYTNYLDSIKLYEISIGSSENKTHITEPFDKYSWVIDSETKQIGQYTCRKATGSYTKLTYCCGEKEFQITAWFAPQLPFPFGPMGYDGLPGLVLEVTHHGTVPTGYVAEEIEITEFKDSVIPSLAKPVKIMTEEELNTYALDRIERTKRQ